LPNKTQVDCFASGQNIIDLGFGLETRNLEEGKRLEGEEWQRCRGGEGKKWAVLSSFQ